MRLQRSACQPRRQIGTLVLSVLAAGLLGGCETNGGPSNPLSELVAYSSGAQASAQASAQANAQAGAQVSAQAQARQEVRQPERPNSRAQAAMDCWAMVEKSKAGASLDARADFVNDCIDKKLGASNGGGKSDARATAAAPKPRPRAEAKPAS